MRYEIYKPNPKNTGCAASFAASEDEDGKMILFLNVIQQASWNDSTKTGSFSANKNDPTKSASVMFNATECGTILYAFDKRVPRQFYHKTQKGTKAVTISPWDKTMKVRVKGNEIESPSHAFGLSVVVDGANSFSLPLEPGEIENVKALLTSALLKAYSKPDKKFQKLDGGDEVSTEE
jgi:hypothetical protein